MSDTIFQHFSPKNIIFSYIGTIPLSQIRILALIEYYLMNSLSSNFPKVPKISSIPVVGFVVLFLYII